MLLMLIFTMMILNMIRMMLTVMQLSAEQVWSWLAASISVKLCLPHREETCTFQQNSSMRMIFPSRFQTLDFLFTAEEKQRFFVTFRRM